MAAPADTAWSEVGALRPESGPVPRGIPFLLAALPVAVQVVRLDHEPVAALPVAALCGALAAAPLRRGITPFASVAALAVAIGVVGPAAAIVFVALALGWAVAAADRADGARSHLAPALIAPLLAADAFLVLREGLVVSGVLVGLMGVTWMVSRLRPHSLAGVTRRVESIGDALGRVLSAIAMVPAAAVVMAAWGWDQVFRSDPLAVPGGGWVDRAAPDAHPQRLYRSSSTAPPNHRPRRVARSLAVVALVVAVVAGVGYCSFYRDPPGPPTSPAFASEPEFDQVWAEQQGFSRNVVFDPVAVYGFSDFRSQYVNQVGGVRTTWQPPPCECPRLKVWWFGGSAGWGFFQSDDLSVPSALARAAWDRGVALEIENRALPGYTLGNESQKFSALSATEPAPDLAIFYDGANELEFQVERNAAGRGADESPVVFYSGSLESAYDLFDRVVGLTPSRAEGEVVPGSAPGPILDAPEVAQRAVNRYRRGVDLAGRVADSIGTRAVFVWQPTQSTASSAAIAPFASADPWSEGDREWWRRLVEAARADLPPEVIDLSDVFARSREPIMPDWSHTNAEGARLVAEALAEELVVSLGAEPG